MATVSADRNLLVGILALQHGLIDRDTLVEAMQAWLLDREQPLERFIRDRARLNPEEELLLEAISGGRLVLPQDNPFRGRRILFHGHCHQKALAGTAATVALLRSIPGADVTEVDAGCCGMAGSFGFEAEHYELSMRIGGLRLFPAIRAEPEETVIAATGVSCRQQIGHGTGRPARHPLEIIRQALPVPGP